MFVSKSKFTSFLESITDMDSVPPELLSIIRNTVFVDATTNKTLEIPIEYSRDARPHSCDNAV